MEHNRGFTMMELLIVLVIIGLLAALVGPTLYKQISPAKTSVAKAQIENFMSALDAYFIDTGTFPTTQQGLIALRDKPTTATNWNGPYLKKELPNDPWGNPYVYKSPGRNGGYEILSLGSDGSPGGAEDAKDVTSWES
ncbi:MAG: type II secretion system major pseudopilin GspG [Pseudomonadales bacterium]|nr:type II secretion system major pseudopilin GspG [Pseudomonadales bacterium]